MNELVPHEPIENKIFQFRGQKVMIDTDLALLYGIPVKVLNQSVKRNAERFPDDFMFQLTAEETETLRSQIVTSNNEANNPAGGRGGRRYLPFAFTEEGVAMLSSVIRSPRAILVNIAIMRAFVKLRELISTHKELAQKLVELEWKVEQHDSDIHDIFEAIRRLMQPPDKPKRGIGFGVGEPMPVYGTPKRKNRRRENV